MQKKEMIIVAIFLVSFALVIGKTLLSDSDFKLFTSEEQPTFEVNFSLKQKNATEMGMFSYDVWDIRVHQNVQNTLRDVDVFINGDLVRHYDYKTQRDAVAESVKVAVDGAVTVKIYWEGGEETFSSSTQ